MRIVFRDLESYERFLKNKLTRLKGIASIETSFALAQVKRSEALPIEQGLTLEGRFETRPPIFHGNVKALFSSAHCATGPVAARRNLSKDSSRRAGSIP